MRKYLALLLAILFAGIGITSGRDANSDWLSPNDVYVIPSYQPTPVEYWWNAPSYSHYSYYYNSYDPWWNVNVYHSPYYRTYYNSWYYPTTYWSSSWSGSYWRTYGSYAIGGGIFLS